MGLGISCQVRSLTADDQSGGRASTETSDLYFQTRGQASVETMPYFHLEWECVRWRESKRRLTKHQACLSGIGAILALGEMWMVVQKEHWYHYMSCKNAELLVSSCLVSPQRLLILCSVQCADFGKNHSPPLPLFSFFG